MIIWLIIHFSVIIVISLELWNFETFFITLWSATLRCVQLSRTRWPAPSLWTACQFCVCALKYVWYVLFTWAEKVSGEAGRQAGRQINGLKCYNTSPLHYCPTSCPQFGKGGHLTRPAGASCLTMGHCHGNDTSCCALQVVGSIVGRKSLWKTSLTLIPTLVTCLKIINYLSQLSYLLLFFCYYLF